jgi:hypothetical protein
LALPSHCQNQSPVPHPNLFIAPAIVKTPDDCVIYRGQIFLHFIQEFFDSTILKIFNYSSTPQFNKELFYALAWTHETEDTISQNM